LTAYASNLEIGISEATGVSVPSVRLNTVRLLAELNLGRLITGEEYRGLCSRIYSSFPRHNRKTVFCRDPPATDEEAAAEVFRILKCWDVIPMEGQAVEHGPIPGAF
jgi:hypothetical protein